MLPGEENEIREQYQGLLRIVSLSVSQHTDLSPLFRARRGRRLSVRRLEREDFFDGDGEERHAVSATGTTAHGAGFKIGLGGRDPPAFA
jgi:hypothetical protein